MHRLNQESPPRGSGLLLSLAALAVVEFYVFREGLTWRTLVIFLVFAFGFVELLRAAIEVRSDEQSSKTAFSAVAGAALLLVAVYLAAREPSGWRVILGALVVVLVGWAGGRLAPSDEAPKKAPEPDSEQRRLKDEGLMRSPRVF
jgi:hypothetical protein